MENKKQEIRLSHLKEYPYYAKRKLVGNRIVFSRLTANFRVTEVVLDRTQGVGINSCYLDPNKDRPPSYVGFIIGEGQNKSDKVEWEEAFETAIKQINSFD